MSRTHCAVVLKTGTNSLLYAIRHSSVGPCEKHTRVSASRARRNSATITKIYKELLDWEVVDICKALAGESVLVSRVERIPGADLHRSRNLLKS